MPWLFFQNEAGAWRWARVGDDGCTKSESQAHFATRLECIADAKASGFGRERHAASALGACSANGSTER